MRKGSQAFPFNQIPSSNRNRDMALVEKIWWSKDTVAVVTGANKGIGLEIARQLAVKGLTVVLTARDSGRGGAAVAGLKKEGLDSVVFHPLDIGSSESIESLSSWLKDRFGGIDILVNNAGIVRGTYDYATASDVVGTNYSGVKNVTKALLPLMRASAAGARVVNVTSRAGLYERLRSESLKETFRDEDNYTEELAERLATKFLTDMKEGRGQEEGWIDSTFSNLAIYGDSKLFLNLYSAALAKSLAKSQPEGHRIFVATFCPGITQTDMLQEGVDNGFIVPKGFPVKTVSDGADTGVWLALLAAKEWSDKTGKLFAEREEFLFGIKNPP